MKNIVEKMQIICQNRAYNLPSLDYKDRKEISGEEKI